MWNYIMLFHTIQPKIISSASSFFHIRYISLFCYQSSYRYLLSATTCCAVIYNLYIMVGRNRYDFKDIKNKSREWIKSMMNLLPREEHPNALFQSSFTGRRDITREIMADGGAFVACLQIIHSQANFIELLKEEAMELKSGGVQH